MMQASSACKASFLYHALKFFMTGSAVPRRLPSPAGRRYREVVREALDRIAAGTERPI